MIKFFHQMEKEEEEYVNFCFLTMIYKNWTIEELRSYFCSSCDFVHWKLTYSSRMLETLATYEDFRSEQSFQRPLEKQACDMGYAKWLIDTFDLRTVAEMKSFLNLGPIWQGFVSENMEHFVYQMLNSRIFEDNWPLKTCTTLLHYLNVLLSIILIVICGKFIFVRIL